MPSGKRSPGATVVGPAAWERALFWVGVPLLGAGAGWLLKVVAGWAASLPWAPFQGPLRLIGSIPATAFTIGAVTVGALAGVVFALIAEEHYVKVTVDDDGVTVVCRGVRREVPRRSIAAVFRDAKQLVVLDHDGGEPIRQGSDLPAEQRLADAFLAHGYRWLADGDPHRDDFQRWVDGHPDLPVAAHAFLKARLAALEKDDAADVEELRRELAKLGIVVREEKKRQYWRRAARMDGESS